MKIDRVEVQVVGPEVERYTWSHDLPDQYMTNTIVRIYTDDGVEGVGAVGVDFVVIAQTVVVVIVIAVIPLAIAIGVELAGVINGGAVV